MNIFQKVLKLDLPVGQYTVCGSSLLDVYGLREINDIDIIVTPSVYENLKKLGWEEKCKEGSYYLVKDDFEIYDTWICGTYRLSAEKLIKKSELIEGIPFVVMAETLKWKREFARPKDIQDVKLIEDYLLTKDF